MRFWVRKRSNQSTVIVAKSKIKIFMGTIGVWNRQGLSLHRLQNPVGSGSGGGRVVMCTEEMGELRGRAECSAVVSCSCNKSGRKVRGWLCRSCCGRSGCALHSSSSRDAANDEEEIAHGTARQRHGPGPWSSFRAIVAIA
eukprot:11323478-Ditylum_brightwellii.AAC.1